MKTSVFVLGAAIAIYSGLSPGPATAADAGLVAAAKQEGRVVWYTTQQIDQLSRPLAEAFEKTYGIRVDYVRANTSDVAIRLINEARAGQTQADVFDGSDAAAVLKKANLALKWQPESVNRLPKAYFDPQGYWVATNLYVLTPAYNTDLMAKGSEPQTFADLLDPKLKGKMAWGWIPSSSAAAGFVGLILTEMGEEKGMAYLRALAQQNIAQLPVAARQVLDQVIAGEYDVGLQVFNHQVGSSARQGAPVAWIAMQPAMVTLAVISITRSAPHPNAGKLFVDFALSPDGQKIYRDAGYLTVEPSVPPLDPSLKPDDKTFRALSFTPEMIEDAMPRWMKTAEDLFK